MWIYCGIFIFVIFFILTVLVFYKNVIYSGIINGLWLSTEEFNNKSDISSMILLIDDDESGKSVDILIYKGPDLIHSKQYHITLGTDYNIFNTKNYSCNVSSDISIMDEDMNIDISNTGLLVLLKNDKIYFEGIRF